MNHELGLILNQSSYSHQKQQRRPKGGFARNRQAIGLAQLRKERTAAKNTECFFCMFQYNPDNDALVALCNYFKDNLVKQDSVSMFKSMEMLYNNMREECDKEGTTLPRMTAEDIETHFRDHIISKTLYVTSLYHDLNMLRDVAGQAVVTECKDQGVRQIDKTNFAYFQHICKLQMELLTSLTPSEPMFFNPEIDQE